MKKTVVPGKVRNSVDRPCPSLKGKEKKAFLASVEQLEEQCGRLGLLDPAGIEPAVIYSAREENE